MKKISVFILFIAISGKVFAQSLTDFESFRRNMLNDYSAYKQTALSDYQAFRDSINQAYANALKGLWSEENVIEGEPNPEDDVKPIPPIVYETPRKELFLSNHQTRDHLKIDADLFRHFAYSLQSVRLPHSHQWLYPTTPI